MIRYLLAATFLLVAYKFYLLGRQWDDIWFFLASAAFALGSIGSFVRILLTYRGEKR